MAARGGNLMEGGVVYIVGQGNLADLAQHLLSAKYPIKREKRLENVPREASLVLVVSDNWNPALYQKANQLFQSKRIPWVRGYVSFGEGVIGPFILYDKPGCSQCADIRGLIAGADRREMWRIEAAKLSERLDQSDVWAARTGIFHMALLMNKEAEQIMDEGTSSLVNTVILINLRSLAISRHSFLPDPLCPICNTLPQDSPELAELEIKTSAKTRTDSYRCRSIEELKGVLAKDYLDFRMGVMNGEIPDYSLPFADVIVNMPLIDGDEGTAGRSHSYEESRLTAILEGLERYCGIGPRGKKTTVRNSYRNLEKIALHPARVGLHEKEQYAKIGFPFKRFDPDAEMNWIWGYSFLQQKPTLVPELLAYYSLGFGDEGIVYETSNGCALGGSLEEAIFHGIMEVVERDSFLLTWYARLPLPRIDLSTIKDVELQLMVLRMREVAGYDLYVYNSTMEHSIPSIWAIAKNKKSNRMNLICAAGASLDPIKAIKSAIFELAGMMFRHDEKLEKNKHKYQRMLHNPYEVQTMEDHGLLYGLPEAEERLYFLMDGSRPLRRFEDEFEPPPAHSDLKDDLEYVLQQFRDLNLEVIVIDQTTPVIKQNGLYCVKVLIPGMLPMTFGHHLTRITGLERVLHVPVTLGYAKKTLKYEDLNPYPHPFP
jgi:ribosomal protein S12 methylthiotransferase accessory factor